MPFSLSEWFESAASTLGSVWALWASVRGVRRSPLGCGCSSASPCATRFAPLCPWPRFSGTNAYWRSIGCSSLLKQWVISVFNIIHNKQSQGWTACKTSYRSQKRLVYVARDNFFNLFLLLFVLLPILCDLWLLGQDCGDSFILVLPVFLHVRICRHQY